MMDQSERDAGLPLQRPEVSEERGDLTGYIFVDAMDSHQRIEYEHHWVMDEDRGLEPVLVLDAIQAERLRCDNPDIETREVESADPGECFEAGAQSGGGVFGGVEQDRAGSVNWEGSEALGAGGNGYGHVQREPALPGLRAATDHTHGAVGPELFDEPRLRLCRSMERRGPDDRQRNDGPVACPLAGTPAVTPFRGAVRQDPHFEVGTSDLRDGLPQRLGVSVQQPRAKGFVRNVEKQRASLAAGEGQRAKPGVEASGRYDLRNAGQNLGPEIGVGGTVFVFAH